MERRARCTTDIYRSSPILVFYTLLLLQMESFCLRYARARTIVTKGNGKCIHSESFSLCQMHLYVVVGRSWQRISNFLLC